MQSNNLNINAWGYSSRNLGACDATGATDKAWKALQIEFLVPQSVETTLAEDPSSRAEWSLFAIDLSHELVQQRCKWVDCSFSQPKGRQFMRWNFGFCQAEASKKDAAEEAMCLERGTVGFGTWKQGFPAKLWQFWRAWIHGFIGAVLNHWILCGIRCSVKPVRITLVFGWPPFRHLQVSANRSLPEVGADVILAFGNTWKSLTLETLETV